MVKTQLPDVAGIHLSDLFFNFPHSSFDSLNQEHNGREEMEAAILQDARDFVRDYNIPCDPELLAADFMERL